MAKKKPTKPSALAGAIETDVDMIENQKSSIKTESVKPPKATKKVTSTLDVQNVQVQKKNEDITSTTGENLKNNRGKRGKGDYIQLCVHIPKELRKPFRHAVVENDLDNSTFIEMLIREHLTKNST